MATITLEYDGRNRAIKQLIEVLFTLGAKEAVSDSEEKTQKQMVKESLSTAFDELHAGKARKNARGNPNVTDFARERGKIRDSLQ